MAPEVSAALLGIFTGFFVSLFGWQINLLVFHRGMHRGRTAGFFVGVGACLADIVWMMLVMAGLSPLIHQTQYTVYFRWVSIVMLLGMAIRMFFAKMKPVEEKATDELSLVKSMILGIAVVISNPFILIFWLTAVSFLVTHYPEAQIIQNKAPFLLAFLVGALSWFLFLTLGASKFSKAWTDATFQKISRVLAVGLVLGALAMIWMKF